MDIQDVYNDKKEFTGIKKTRNEFNEDEYSMSTFIWIINDDGKLLVQMRSLKDDNKPGTWGITGGAVDAGESSLMASVRELREELGLVINQDELIFVASERRKRKFFEYYMLNSNININELRLQKDEVERVEWITLEEYEKNISNALNFQLFKNFYNNIYLPEKNKTM